MGKCTRRRKGLPMHFSHIRSCLNIDNMTVTHPDMSLSLSTLCGGSDSTHWASRQFVDWFSQLNRTLDTLKAQDGVGWRLSHGPDQKAENGKFVPTKTYLNLISLTIGVQPRRAWQERPGLRQCFVSFFHQRSHLRCISSDIGALSL